MTPRFVIFATYPLLFVASGAAAYQTRRLARYLPSKAWSWKLKLMTFFMLAQIFGAGKLWLIPRDFKWIDCMYLICVLLFSLGLNYFDYLLLRDYKHFRASISRLPKTETQSGEMPPDFWRQEFRQAVRDEIRPEFLRANE